MESSTPPISSDLRVALLARDGTAISLPLPIAVRMGYTAGLIEDLAEGVRVLEVPFPFMSSAARTVLSLADGKRCGAVFGEDGGQAGLSEQHGGGKHGSSSKGGLRSLKTLAAVVDACNASSYLQAADVEHALLKFVAMSLEGCGSCGEVCLACGVAQGPLSREEAALVVRLAAQSDRIAVTEKLGRSGAGQGGGWHTRQEGAGCDVGQEEDEDEVGDLLAAFRLDSYHALYGGVLLGGADPSLLPRSQT